MKNKFKNKIFFLILLIVLVLFGISRDIKIIYFSFMILLIYAGIIEIFKIIKMKNKKDSSVILSYSAILAYLIIYFVISLIRDYRYLKTQTIVIFLKILLSTLIFYSALIGIKTGKGWFRGFPLNRTELRIINIIEIIIAILLLVFI